MTLVIMNKCLKRRHYRLNSADCLESSRTTQLSKTKILPKEYFCACKPNFVISTKCRYMTIIYLGCRLLSTSSGSPYTMKTYCRHGLARRYGFCRCTRTLLHDYPLGNLRFHGVPCLSTWPSLFAPLFLQMMGVTHYPAPCITYVTQGRVRTFLPILSYGQLSSACIFAI